MFDPYYTWLGIPPGEQPPNHYRLLGINLFEASSDAIAYAADRQMVFLRGINDNEHIEDAQKLLNEVAEIKASYASGGDLAGLAQSQQTESHLAELRAAEGMLDRMISFNDPNSGEPVTERVKAVVLQDGLVWLETDSYSLNVSDVARIEL